MGADDSDLEMMGGEVGEFRESSALKVGLAWILYPWARHSSQGRC